MRIAQVSPLDESVPPKTYGGTERVVSYLTEELVRLGHEVTLFASGDSTTSAKLIPGCPVSLRLGQAFPERNAYLTLMNENIMRRARDFDVIHYHIDTLHLPLARRCSTPSVTTLHGRLDFEALSLLYREYSDAPLVAISEAQRRTIPHANWCPTVHHGLPLDLLPFQRMPGDYLAFLGRISPEKGIEDAIAIALRTGMRLKIAAKIGDDDHAYHRSCVEPLLDHPLIDFIGEIGEDQKGEFLGGARALLFPIRWPEPFGLVMIEALACGTPVIAFPGGSVAEVLEDGVTGFIVPDVTAACAAVERIDTLPRIRCRNIFERRFSATRMAVDYLAVYADVVAARATAPKRVMAQ
jgi:glycosyltransferase involved in cell wall biosynthesis